MKLRLFVRLVIPVAVGALVLAACGGDDDDSASANNTGATTTTAAAATSTSASGATSGSFTVAVAKTSLGDTLVDAQGRTLYAFKADKGGKSVCNTGCVENWPPLTVTGAIKLAPGLDEDDFKTITRDDGTTQVTDYGQPLYRYAGDSKAGDTHGDGVAGVWYAVGSEGKPANTSASGTASTEAPTTTTALPGY
jgi:predicted lipoprotein with Yx(FWY)xxD motif